MKMNPPASSSSPTSRKKPRIMRHPMSLAPENAVSHYWHGAGNSTTSASYQRLPIGPPGFGARKALTLQFAPSIRPPMAADAILPPLFFERRRRVSDPCSENGILVEHPETYQRRSRS